MYNLVARTQNPEHDAYSTPEWAAADFTKHKVFPSFQKCQNFWEPACCRGNILKALSASSEKYIIYVS